MPYKCLTALSVLLALGLSVQAFAWDIHIFNTTTGDVEFGVLLGGDADIKRFTVGKNDAHKFSTGQNKCILWVKANKPGPRTAETMVTYPATGTVCNDLYINVSEVNQKINLEILTAADYSALRAKVQLSATTSVPRLPATTTTSVPRSF